MHHRRITWAHTFARALTWFALASFISVAALTLLLGRKQPLIGSYDPAARLTSFGSLPPDRRAVRRHGSGDGAIVCIEPPHARIGAASEGKAVPGGSTNPQLYLREAGWQLCNAYLNGVITRQQYGAALLALINMKSLPAPANELSAGTKMPALKSRSPRCRGAKRR